MAINLRANSSSGLGTCANLLSALPKRAIMHLVTVTGFPADSVTNISDVPEIVLVVTVTCSSTRGACCANAVFVTGYRLLPLLLGQLAVCPSLGIYICI